MSCYAHRILRDEDDFASIATPWNDLWQRSDARQPTVRAEGILAWIAAFADRRQLTTICVEEAGRLVAALPLIGADKRLCLSPTRLPTNCWANAGDLLLDPAADARRAVASLLDGVAEAGLRLLALEEIDLAAPCWRVFAEEIERRNGSFCCRRQSRVGVVDILHDWERYERSWSGNHRSAVRRSYKKLCQAGDVRTERYATVNDPLEQLLSTAFEIEHRSWKGEAGTSVLSTPGMFQYMVTEANHLARDGHLDLWFLYLDDKPIAFEYCHVAKGICFSHKIGYEAEYARFGPGRLLRYLQLQAYHADSEFHQFDMLGTLCPAKAKWATSTYEVGDCLAAVDGPAARLGVSAYKKCRTWVRRWRGRPATEAITPGAAACVDTPTPDAVAI